jgi:hypothetical protein
MNTSECNLDTCPKGCGVVPRYRRTCEACETFVGFPNVRYALREIEDLNRRYEEAYALAEVQSAEHQLKNLDAALITSKAVVVRKVTDVIHTLSSGSGLWSTFGKQLRAEVRSAEDNIWDENRGAVESIIHPNFHEEIRYAGLSLDDFGVTDPAYGECHLLLKSEFIEDRASVFEENTFSFMERHKIVAGKGIPKGYRAAWKDRHKLGVSKLASKITHLTEDAVLNDVLKSGYDKSADFIEVHIFGSINSKTIEKLTVLSDKINKTQIRLLKAHAKKIDMQLSFVNGI